MGFEQLQRASWLTEALLGAARADTCSSKVSQKCCWWQVPKDRAACEGSTLLCSLTHELWGGGSLCWSRAPSRAGRPLCQDGVGASPAADIFCPWFSTFYFETPKRLIKFLRLQAEMP